MIDKNVSNTPSGYTFVGLYRKVLAQKMNPNLFLKLQPAYGSNGVALSSDWFAVYKKKDPVGLSEDFSKYTQKFI